MLGEIVQIGAGVVRKVAGFRLPDKPWAGSGVERLTFLRWQHFRRAQMAPFCVRQRDRRHRRHQVLQMHQHLQTVCRIDIYCLIYSVVTGEVHRSATKNIVIFSQDGFGIVHRQIMGEVTINFMIILNKILPL